MKIIKTAAALKKVLPKNKTLGFVPTMGALHEGHLSLIKKSIRDNDFTIVSIYVNPTQFNDKKDLKNYPITIEQDIKKLAAAGVDFLFMPSYKEMYPDGYSYRAAENNISKTLCGASRPGHFEGVLTIVLKLLNLIQPAKAYFGEKDFQQYLLIKGMARAFFIKTRIIPCKIIRENDGLAKSSRNALLSAEQRARAPLFNKILRSKKNIPAIKKELAAAGFQVDYIEEKYDRIFGAVFAGKVRLIDNVKR